MSIKKRSGTDRRNRGKTFNKTISIREVDRKTMHQYPLYSGHGSLKVLIEQMVDQFADAVAAGASSVTFTIRQMPPEL